MIKLSKNAKIGLGIVIFVFVVMIFLYKISLNIWGAYTVGRITDITPRSKVVYEFYSDGEKYSGMITKQMKNENVNRPYFIQYLKSMPSINLLIPEKPADSCYEAFKNTRFDQIPICK